MEAIAPNVCKLFTQNLTAKVIEDQDVAEPLAKMDVDDIESPQDADEEAIEDQIRSPKSPRSPRKRRAAQSTESGHQSAPEQHSFEEGKALQEDNALNLEQYEGADEFIPEEQGGVDFETNEPEVPESQMTEEQASGEKDEEFQERRWTKRTQQLMHTLKRELQKKDNVTLDTLTKEQNRKQVACKFYSCLLLKRDNEVELQQKNAFGRILVSKGPCFYTA